MSEKHTLLMISYDLFGFVNGSNTGFLLNIAHIKFPVEFISLQIQTKSRIFVGGQIMHVSNLLFWKGIDIEFQSKRCINRTFDFLKIGTVGDKQQMLCIETERFYRDVIEPFIKNTKNRNFYCCNSTSYHVIFYVVCDTYQRNFCVCFFFKYFYLQIKWSNPFATSKVCRFLRLSFLSVKSWMGEDPWPFLRRAFRICKTRRIAKDQ